MAKCTGINCPMQFDSVDPANCKAVDSCQYATRPITRADHIRAMTDEELGEFLGEMVDHPYCTETGCKFKRDGFCRYPDYGCDENALVWLKQEVRDG